MRTGRGLPVFLISQFSLIYIKIRIYNNAQIMHDKGECVAKPMQQEYNKLCIGYRPNGYSSYVSP